MNKEFSEIDISRVVKVEKIYNMYNHQRFEQEFKRLSEIKHKEKAPLDLVKHLFHGTG